MKTQTFIAISFMILKSTLIFSKQDSSGIFLTANDYMAHKLSLSINCKTQKHKTEEINPAQKQSLLKLGEVSILLGSYNDIFSDFDPSPYSERTLSDDFIIQVKKFYENKKGN